MNALILEYRGIPKAKQSFRYKKIGNSLHSYQKKEIVGLEQTIGTTFRTQLPKGFMSFKGSLRVEYAFIYAYPKALERQRKKFPEKVFYKPSRPDTDNLQKLCNDAMNGVIFMDDSQIVEVIARKLYGDYPQTIIKIFEIEAKK